MSIISLVAALSIVSPARAFTYWPSTDIHVDNTHTTVTTVAKTEANTGYNKQFGGTFSSMTTGHIVGASAVAENQVNATILPSCACNRIGDIVVKNEQTTVKTIAKVELNTGSNTQVGVAHFTMPKTTTGTIQNVGSSTSAIVNYTDFSVQSSTP